MGVVAKDFVGDENKKLVQAVESIVGGKIVRAMIRPEGSRVFLEDYSQEEQKVQELLTKYQQLRSQLTGNVTKDEAILVEMGMIAKEFENLTGLNITEVI